MRSWRLWLLLFVLWDSCPTVTAAGYVFRKPEGGEQTVTCRWSYTNIMVSRRVFCRNDCWQKDLLVQTTGSGQTYGRYRIKHENKGSPPVDLIAVTISNLTLSDSGVYRCFWDSPVQGSYTEFRIEVTEGVHSESKLSVSAAAGEDFSHCCSFSTSGSKKSFCRNTCSEEDTLVMTKEDKAQHGRYSLEYHTHAEDLSFVTVTIKNLSHADSGAYHCSLDQSTRKFWIEVAPGASPKTQDLNLTLILILVCVVLIIMTTCLTIYCRRRTGTGGGDPAGGAPDFERVYEEVLPASPSGGIYQGMCLEDMDTYDQLCDQPGLNKD